MFQPITKQAMVLSKIISTLSRLRQERQETTVEISLLEINGNMGPVMAYLINSFGLNVNALCRILGKDLFLELKDFLHEPKKKIIGPSTAPAGW